MAKSPIAGLMGKVMGGQPKPTTTPIAGSKAPGAVAGLLGGALKIGKTPPMKPGTIPPAKPPRGGMPGIRAKVPRGSGGIAK